MHLFNIIKNFILCLIGKHNKVCIIESRSYFHYECKICHKRFEPNQKELLFHRWIYDIVDKIIDTAFPGGIPEGEYTDVKELLGSAETEESFDIN